MNILIQSGIHQDLDLGYRLRDTDITRGECHDIDTNSPENRQQ